ncbi:MAG: demethylmenaquinone methyltransferase [Peptococcaceae bacterium]|nr:demethylmenaquinone methyltransferase [Peptococcaceae bacterium]
MFFLDKFDAKSYDNSYDNSSKEKKVYDVFQTISPHYDKMNDIISSRMHRRWKADLIKQIATQKCLSVLDICCGTGDIALRLAQENPHATIHGLDFSENMLAAAEDRKTGLDLNNVLFHHGNAMALPFEDQSFQCVTISFGLRNVPDYEQVLREMHRILEPEGTLYCLDSSYPDSPLVKPFFKVYFKFIMPAFASLFTRHKEEYKWLNDSTEQFLTKNELAHLMKKIGFQEIALRSYFLGSAALHRGKKTTKKGDPPCTEKIL